MAQLCWNAQLFGHSSPLLCAALAGSQLFCPSPSLGPAEGHALLLDPASCTSALLSGPAPINVLHKSTLVIVGMAWRSVDLTPAFATSLGCIPVQLAGKH